MPKYGVFSGPYFPVFSRNTGKYRPEKTPYLDTFHAVTFDIDTCSCLILTAEKESSSIDILIFAMLIIYALQSFNIFILIHGFRSGLCTLKNV